MQLEEVLLIELDRLTKIKKEKIAKKEFYEKEIKSLDESIEKLEETIRDRDKTEVEIVSVAPISKDHLKINFLYRGEKKTGILCYHTLCKRLPYISDVLDASVFIDVEIAPFTNRLVWKNAAYFGMGAEKLFNYSFQF